MKLALHNSDKDATDGEARHATDLETLAEVLEPEPIARLREMGETLGADVPRRILELYLEDAPRRLAEIRRSIAADDAEAMRNALHSLKGSSANLGATAVARLCGELELLADDAMPDGARQHQEALEVEYGKVVLAMTRQLATFT